MHEIVRRSPGMPQDVRQIENCFLNNLDAPVVRTGGEKECGRQAARRDRRGERTSLCARPCVLPAITVYRRARAGTFELWLRRTRTSLIVHEQSRQFSFCGNV